VTRDFAPLKVLIVEGTYVLMLDDLDVRVFLEATHEDTHERRMARNRDIYEPIVDTILGIEHRLIAPQGARADWLIDRTSRIRRGHGTAPHVD
jgi:uridine kinase